MSRQKLLMEKRKTKTHTHQASVWPTSKMQKPGACATVHTVSQSFLKSEVHASGSPAAPHPSAGGRFEAPHRFTLPSNHSAGSLTMMSASALMQQGQPLLRKKAERSTEMFCFGITLGLCKRKLRGTRKRTSSIFLIKCSHF